MCIRLSQVLQRLHEARPPRKRPGAARTDQAHVQKLRERVLAILRVLFDRVDGRRPYQPVWLFVDAIAARAGKGSSTVARALAEAEDLKIIHRVKRGALGAHAAHGWLVHAVLIEASRKKRPWEGEPLLFPRPWNPEGEPPLLHDIRNLDVQELDGKRVGAKPPRPRPPAGGWQPSAPQAPPRAARAAEVAPAVSLSPPPGAGGVGPRLGELSPEVNYWKWLHASAAAGGWADGAVEVVGQRRRRDGTRGGEFPLASSPLQVEVAAAAVHAALAEAARRGLVETSFRLRRQDDAHGLLLIDDVEPSMLCQVQSLVSVCAVLQTSPGNLQISLAAPRALTRDERCAVNRSLQKRFESDLGAVGGAQIRRLPGSMNYKPTLAVPFKSVLLGECVAGTLSERLLVELLAQGAEPVAAAPQMLKRNVAATASGGHAGGGVDQSKLDWAWTKAQLRDGVRADAVEFELLQRARARGKKTPHLYAPLTVKNAIAALARELGNPRRCR